MIAHPISVRALPKPDTDPDPNKGRREGGRQGETEIRIGSVVVRGWVILACPGSKQLCDYVHHY